MMQKNTPSVTRRAFIGACLALGFISGAQAGDWPTRPITLVVPYPAGGLTDTVSRTLGDEVGKILGQPIVIENRAGAGGKIGLDAVRRAPRDGYTIALVVPATMITLPLTDKNYGIDPLKDFEPITIAVDTYLALVTSPALGVHNLKEFTAYAQQHPGKLNYATPGAGTSFHFNNVMLAQKLGIRAAHVPYKGEVQMMTDIANGQIHYALVTNSSKAFVDGGKAVPMAVAAAKRVPAFPNVPTFRELGVDFTTDGWVGYAAAAGTPVPILDKLNAAFTKALALPRIKELFVQMGYNPVGNTRAQFRALIEERTRHYAQLVKSGAVKLEN